MIQTSDFGALAGGLVDLEQLPVQAGADEQPAAAAIQAENELAVAKLNEARAPYGMDALTDPGTETARVDLMFRELAFALYASAHRLGDLRRLVRQYGRPSETVYPTGAYHKDGLTLGTDLQFVVPQTEKNNPKFKGCINRDA